MRSLMSFLIGMLAATAAAVVGLGISVAQQGEGAQFAFLGVSLQADQRWIFAGAVALGFLLALLLAALLLIPDRLASARHIAALSRQAREQEGQLRVLREQYAQLQGGYGNLLEEHQRVMGRVLSPAVPVAPTTSVMPAPAVPTTVVSADRAPVVSSAVSSAGPSPGQQSS